MKTPARRRGGASWTKTWASLTFFAVALGVVFWFAPDRTKELRDCQTRCTPRSGVMTIDPRFAHSFKGDTPDGFRVCTCLDPAGAERR